MTKLEKNDVASLQSSIKVSEQKLCVNRKPIYVFLKRLFDILFSILGLIVLFIPLLIIAVIIMIDSPGASPIYVQKRVGKNGKLFSFYKFRTMVPGAEKMIDNLLEKNEMDGPVFKIKHDPRITRFGRFLRKASIDELPQLVNVVKGDMSLVGPRPPLPREVDMYTDYQMQRLSVTPGITCYWQVMPKRNSVTFDEWVELDLRYISKQCLFTDLILIFKSLYTS